MNRTATALSPAQRKTLYEMIEEWHKYAEAAAVAREAENLARMALVDRFFPDSEYGEGTHTIKTEYGKELKVQKPVARTVDEEQLDAAVRSSKIMRSLAEELFSYKPCLKIGKWKELSDDQRAMFSEIITEKYSMPQVKLHTPGR